MTSNNCTPLHVHLPNWKESFADPTAAPPDPNSRALPKQSYIPFNLDHFDYPSQFDRPFEPAAARGFYTSNALLLSRHYAACPTALFRISWDDAAHGKSSEQRLPDVRVAELTLRPPEACSKGTPIGYAILLSRVAEAFRARMPLSRRVKDELEYPDAFDGADVVDKICFIIRTTGWSLALSLGRALDTHKFFHNVT
jgi:hypothetical protein